MPFLPPNQQRQGRQYKLNLLAWVSCSNLCQYSFSLCSTDSSCNLAVLVLLSVADAQRQEPGYHRDLIVEQKNHSLATHRTSHVAENQHRQIFSKMYKWQFSRFTQQLKQNIQGFFKDLITSASLSINVARTHAVLTDLLPIPPVSLCRLVGLSIQKVYCGKTANWIRIPFGMVSGVSRGTGVLDGMVIIKG